MVNKIVVISTSIVASAIILIVIIGSDDLSAYQNETLRYNMNTDCQVYAEFVNRGITQESLNDPKINPKLKPLIQDLLSLEGDPRNHLEEFNDKYPHCKNELVKLKPVN